MQTTDINDLFSKYGIQVQQNPNVQNFNNQQLPINTLSNSFQLLQYQKDQQFQTRQQQFPTNQQPILLAAGMRQNYQNSNNARQQVILFQQVPIQQSNQQAILTAMHQNFQNSDTAQKQVLQHYLQVSIHQQNQQTILTAMHQDFLKQEQGDQQKQDSQKIEVVYDNSRKSFDVKKAQMSQKNRQHKHKQPQPNKKDFLRKSQRMSDKGDKQVKLVLILLILMQQIPVAKQTMENAQIKDYIAKSKFNQKQKPKSFQGKIAGQKKKKKSKDEVYYPLKSVKQGSKKKQTKKKKSQRKSKKKNYRPASMQFQSQRKNSRASNYSRNTYQGSQQSTMLKSEQLKHLESQHKDVADYLYGSKEYKKLLGNNYKTRRQTDQLIDHLYQKGEKIKYDLQQKRQEKMKADMAEVKNKPTLVTQDASQQKRKSRRSWKRFLQDQNQHLENIKKKTLDLKQTIEKQEEQIEPNAPELCEQSLQIIQGKRSNESIFERLYELSKNPLQKVVRNIIEHRDTEYGDAANEEVFQSEKSVSENKDTQKLFIPEILQKSKEIIREQKFDVVLYKDAERRQKLLKQNQKKMKQKPKTKKILSIKSEAIYAQQFILEFESALNEFNCQYTKMDFSNGLCQVLAKIGFIVNVDELSSAAYIQERTLLFDMWLVLQGDKQEGVTKRNVLVFLFAILGLNFDIEKEDMTKYANKAKSQSDENVVSKSTMSPQFFKAFQEYKENVNIEAQIGYFDQDNDFFLSQEDLALIHQTYEIFYINRMSSKIVRKRYMKKSKVQFKPTTNDFSNQIAGNFRNKIKEDRRKIHPSKQPKYLYTKKTKKMYYPLKPTTKYVKGKVMNHVNLLHDYEKVRIAKLQQMKKQRLVKEKIECTFTPITTHYHIESQEDINTHRDMESEGVFDVKKPFSMPAKSLGKHRAFELYSLAKPRAQRVDRDPDEIEYEKFCDECTFAPDLTSTKDRYDYASPKSFYVKRKGLSKAITRMRQGRHQRQLIKGFKEGRNEREIKAYYENIKKQNSPQKRSRDIQDEPLSTEQDKSGLSPDKIQDVYQDPRNFYVENAIKEEDDDVDYDKSDGGQSPFEDQNVIPEKEDEDEPPPLLFVDVNLGDGKQERIIVKEGDHAEDLATQFAKEHSLDDEMRLKLVDLLNKQIQNLLSRIDEDTHSEQDYQIANTPPAE